MPRDVEGGACTARPKRPTAFLILGVISLSWLGAMVFMMRHVHAPVAAKVEEGTDFLGADIDGIFGVESMVACRTHCEDHPRCLAFTFVAAEQACWLKGPWALQLEAFPG